MNRLAPIRVAAVALALGLPACAGDDAPTQAEYAKEAAKVCRDAESRLEEIGRDASSPEEIAEAVDTVIEETRSSVDALEELELPEGDGREVAERFVETQSELAEQGVPVLEDLRDSIEAGDERGAQDAVERLEKLGTDRSDELARRLGAKACAG